MASRDRDPDRDDGRIATPLLHLVTNRACVPGADLVGTVERVLRWLPPKMVRVEVCEPEASARQHLELIEALRPVCLEREAALWTFERIDVAVAAGLAGVRLPADGPSVRDVRRIWSGGVAATCLDARAVTRAANTSADWAVLTPIYPSDGSWRAPLGPEALGEAKAAAGSMPLFAGGGVTAATAARIRDAGADGIVATTSVLADLDAVTAACDLARAWGRDVALPPQFDRSLPVVEHP